MTIRKRYLAVIAGVTLPAAGLATLQFGGVSRVQAFNPSKAPVIQQRLLSQFADNALGFHALPARATSSLNLTPTKPGGPPCSQQLGSNVKRNQGSLNIS